MKKLNIILVIVAIAMIPFIGLAQTQGGEAQVIKPPKYPDGIYTKENTINRRPIPYTSLREADVMWSRRVWRQINLKEKINHPLYYPTTPILDRKSLFDVLKDGVIKTSTVSCFEDDEFKLEYTKSEIEAKLSSVDSSGTTIDAETGEEVQAIIKNDVTSENITQYQIKEDWFYDKQRSVLDVRIIGLMVMKAKTDPNGEYLGEQSLFWVYFPEIRPELAKQEVYMRHNDAERRTLEDIFWKRMFSSYVIKESNVYDRMIADYTKGMNALLESERIKTEIFNLEHDLWHF